MVRVSALDRGGCAAARSPLALNGAGDQVGGVALVQGLGQALDPDGAADVAAHGLEAKLEAVDANALTAAGGLLHALRQVGAAMTSGSGEG